MPIMTVALDWFAAGFADGVLKRGDGLLLRGRRTGHVENFFFQNCAVQIVDAVTERDLCQWQADAHPIGGDVVDVIKIDTADGEIAKLFDGRGGRDVGQDRRLWLKGKRNKAGKTARLILKPAQLTQVIDSMRKGLDVTVKHRAGAAATHFMPDAMNIEPFGSTFFSATDRIAHGRIENFRAATGDRTKTMFAQKLQHFSKREAKDALREVTHFDGGERLDM